MLTFLMGMIALAGCAYFNSFYNARKNFREAEKQRENSPTQQQNTQKYNLAIESAGRISSAGCFDLLLFGKQAIDGDTAQVGPEVAGTLKMPVVTFVTDVREITSGGIVVERAADGCRELVKTVFPSLLTVVRSEKRLRMPTIEGIVSSFSGEVETAGPEDIGADRDRCGLKGSPTRVKNIFSPSSGGRVTYLEGSTEEKAGGFIEVLKKKGFVR